MYFIGIDIGTSGIRACAINEQAQQVAIASQALPPPAVSGNAIEQDANIWWQAVQSVMVELFIKIDSSQVQAICVDGTSGTVLATDVSGKPLAPALLYNDSRARDEAEQIRAVAPADSPAQGLSSGLARILYLKKRHPQAAHFLHQADWVAGKLCNRFDCSDENNVLKSGYDVINRCWPDWLDQLAIDRKQLPQVYQPGEIIGHINAETAAQFHLPAYTKIIAGTTDSIAAFIATGASQPGDAVTSLGSTLVLKIISEQPVSAPQFGIYSHRLPCMSHSDTYLPSPLAGRAERGGRSREPLVEPTVGEGTRSLWLAGGASNSGGAVLRQFFTDEQMRNMTAQLKPEQPTGLNYCPLTRNGERFPVNDADLPPHLTPRPANDVIFFQGMLEAMARIEHNGYKKLHQLGAPELTSVKTAGGGSRNPAWTKIRQQQLNVPVITATQIEACYGSALLAQRGYTASLPNST